MKVLHLYSGNLFGGVERCLITFAKMQFHTPDVEHHFGLCFPGRLREELLACGAVVHDFGAVRISRPWTVWEARRRLKMLHAKKPFDVCITHAGWSHGVFARAAKSLGLPIVHYVHDDLTNAGWLYRWAKRVPPTRVIANSQFTAGTVQKIFPTVPCDVLACPVEDRSDPNREATRATIRVELRTPANAVVILQASRLERMKGQAVHVEALGKLSTVPGWVAWFAGGPQKAGEHEFLRALEQRARMLGISDRVRFLKQRTDIPQLMAAADVLCQPNTRSESFGIVFIEALYSGLPIITSDIGGGAEIVDEFCGVRLPPNDADALAECLKTFVEKPDTFVSFGSIGSNRARELCDPLQQLIGLRKILSAAIGKK